MVLLLLIVLYGSIAGMVLLVVLKSIELRRGQLFLSFIRPAVASISHRILRTMGAFPVIWRILLKRMRYVSFVLIRHWVATAVLWVEHRLEHMLHALRYKTGPASEASPFLREVAEHKKILIRRRVRDREKTQERI